MSRPEAPVGPLLDAGQLAAIARRLGREIARDYPEGVVLVALLKGSICFVADLVRELPGLASSTSWSSRRTGTGDAGACRQGSRPRRHRSGRRRRDGPCRHRSHPLLRAPADRLAPGPVYGRLRALDRQSRRLLPVDIRYVGRVIGEEYVVGYGLDLDERYRNLPGLEIADEAELRAEPYAMFDRLSRR